MATGVTLILAVRNVLQWTLALRPNLTLALALVSSDTYGCRPL